MSRERIRWRKMIFCCCFFKWHFISQVENLDKGDTLGVEKILNRSDAKDS